MMRVFRLLVAALLLAPAAGALAAQARVEVNVSLKGVSVEASVPVAADAATLWSTLTDYNRLPEFVPNLILSRVVSAPGQPKHVEQRADSGWVSFAMPDHVILAVEETPPRQIRFRAVSGSVLAMNGEWRVEGEAPYVQLRYRAWLLPMVPPPPLVSEGFIADTIRPGFEAVAREAERRMRLKGR